MLVGSCACGQLRYELRGELHGPLRLGTLDSDPGRAVEEHIFVSSKVPWVELRDGLPAREGGVSFGERD